MRRIARWLSWPVPRWAALLGLLGTAALWLLDVSFIQLTLLGVDWAAAGAGPWLYLYHLGLGLALLLLWAATLKGE